MTFPADPPNPWTTHATRVRHGNPWTQLEENDVTRPDGAPGTYWVTRFRNRACGIVPFEVRGGVPGVWLVGQTRYALGLYSWELPEGGVPPHEAMETAARRELREETGITAQRLTRLFDIHTSNSVTDEWGQVFLATGLTHGEPDLEGTEDITRLFVPLETALAAINSGRITDAITVAGLLRVELMRLRGGLTDIPTGRV
ncbi:MAG: NUDIX hydrolase [Litorimonas sp.]